MALSPSKSIPDMAVAVKLKSRVVRRVEVPVWMQQCPFIERAYRKQQDSFYGCFESLWYMHNESVNIWSHLIVGVFFLTMAIWAALPSLHGGYAFKRADLLGLQSYLVGAAICCLLSVSTLLFSQALIHTPESNSSGSRPFTTVSAATRSMSRGVV